MARYKEHDYSQGKFIPIHSDKQILPGTFRYSYSGDTLLNSEAVFKFWGVIFGFMLKEDEKISMVSPELEFD